MLHNKLYLVCVAAAITLSSCRHSSEQKSVPDFGEKVNEDMRSHKARKLAQGDILAAANDLGSEIAAQAQTVLISSLTKAIADKGLVEAVAYCNLIAVDTLVQTAKTYNASIKRTALKLRNPNNSPNAMELQLLEAYAYNSENGLALEDNVQLIDQGTKVLFTRPITLAAPLCLNCHGSKENLLPELQAKIDALYPEDQATGFQLNDFRGMWSISLPKSEVVKRIKN
jgi:hypothetical protein